MTRENKVASDSLPASSRKLPFGLSQAFSSLTNPIYRGLWFSTFFSVAAMQINIVSRSWLAYDLSGSALMLGLVAIARGLPQLLLSPLGGVAADRFDKRKLLIATQSVMFLLALANALLVHLGLIQVWQLVVIGLFQGIVFPFTQPARQAYIPDIVDQDEVPNALVTDSTGRNLNRVLAPSVAGLLIAWHPTIAFYSIAALYGVALITLLKLPKPSLPNFTRESAVREMAMGFLGAVFGMPFQQMLPVFQVDVLNVGAEQLGFMYTAVGVGALIASFILAYLSHHPGTRQLQIFVGIGFGIILIPFSQSTNFWLSLVLLAFVGATSQGFMTLNRIFVLTDTDKNLYGRVSGIYMMTWSLMPLATLPIGALVDSIGAPNTITIAGGLLVVFILALSIMVPSAWRKTKKPGPTTP